MEMKQMFKVYGHSHEMKILERIYYIRVYVETRCLDPGDGTVRTALYDDTFLCMFNLKKRTFYIFSRYCAFRYEFQNAGCLKKLLIFLQINIETST